MNDYYIVPNPTGPTSAVDIDEELCIGCNSCANICRIQTILPNPDKGKAPIVAYPDECWYCGCCVEACPTGALQMRLPINQRILFKDRDNGQIFRIGTKDAPEKSFFKAPFGWTDHPELGKVMQLLEDSAWKVNIALPAGCGLQIGRYFGEKDEKDNSEKLNRFLKLIGFDETGYAAENKECVIEAVSENSESGFESRLTVRQLSELIKRLCVSNYTAVHLWQKL